jgi:hypothetical protein
VIQRKNGEACALCRFLRADIKERIRHDTTTARHKRYVPGCYLFKEDGYDCPSCGNAGNAEYGG